MANPYYQVTRDAALALTEFSDEMRSALALAEVTPWAAQFGLVRSTDALKTTFPIPVSAAGYKLLEGDIKFRSLYQRSLSMTGLEWYDGVKEKAAIIEAPDFIDWAGEPSRIANEWLRLPNTRVAAILATSSFAGPLLDFYRDPETDTASTRRLFAADHPFNVFDASVGTFDNRLSVSVTQIQNGTAWEPIEDHFRSIKGPNGQPLGLRWEGGNALIPTTRSTLFKKALEHDTLIRAVRNDADTDTVAAVTQNNIWRGTFGYTVADELTSQDYFYALAAGRPGLFPWVAQQSTAPEERVWDKSSELYLSSSQVAIAYVGQFNAAACLPHGILRVEITG